MASAIIAEDYNDDICAILARVENASSVTTSHDFDGTVGWIKVVESNTAPTDGWDLTVQDENGADLTAGQGTGITAAFSAYYSDLKEGTLCKGKVTFNGADMGAGSAHVYMYIARIRDRPA